MWNFDYCRQGSVSIFSLCCLLAFGINGSFADEGGSYLIGTGIYDVTGPAAQINLMGYARLDQTAHGIHLRLRARAFIMAEMLQGESSSVNDHQSAVSLEAEEENGRFSFLRWRNQKKGAAKPRNSLALKADPERTVCFVSADIGMGSDLLNMKVVKRLKELLPEQPGSGKRLCNLENLSISGTHTHSSPAGFFQYVLYQITSLGYSGETMDAYVEGISQALYRAYNNLEGGSLSVSEDLLFESNINRSPSSYLLNPKAERDVYSNEGDTDKRMLQLRFTAKKDGNDLGIVNWFAVHGTSMNGTNVLLSGDNKGYASYLMERYYNGNDTLPGKGRFVAAFASTNLGDVSPNTDGPKCIDTGLPCDFKTSTCNGGAALCIARGPGKDMFESTEIIGRNQFDNALAQLSRNDSKKLEGEISFRHSFVDMANLTVQLSSGETVHTCPAALGYSFAGGTTDGPGMFDFTQGSNSSNPFWNMISGFISRPDEQQIQCQHPKPILLNTGAANKPYLWDPSSVPISVFRVGQLFILNAPAEFTTMAGRRLRKTIQDMALDAGIHDPYVTIAGLSNTYTHYVATFEEYQGQRYEAASTLYGPHTLSGYIQEFKRLTSDLLSGNPSQSYLSPEDLSSKQLSFIPPVIVDTIAFGKKFGSVVKEPQDAYTSGVDTVFAKFRSANPRNNQRIEGTFLAVDKLMEDGSWKTKYVDGDWCTKFHWNGAESLLGISYAEIYWDIPVEAASGTYRICHYGARKRLFSEAEIAAYRSPDWMTSTAFGSAAFGLFLNTFTFATSMSHKLRDSLNIGRPKIKEFSGCTKSFVVSDSNNITAPHP